MASFKEQFCEVNVFSNGEMVLSAEHFTREEAATEMSDYQGKTISPDDLEAFYIRYGFASPEECEPAEAGVPLWYYPASGRGSKRVWVYRA